MRTDSSAAADAGHCSKDIFKSCATTETHAEVGLSRAAVRRLPKFVGDSGGAVVVSDGKRPVYEYRTLADCSAAVPDTAGENASCMGALRACPPDTVGPLSMIWRRAVLDGVVVEPWTRVGVTCHTDVAPGARPTISMADIRAQFMRTPWAKPTVSSQPVGNVTLVNLTTFYQVSWSRQGFEPGEVDTSNLLGFAVRIRPKLVGFTYVFGDGARFGPTTSTGGVYPDGDVTHTYRARGEFPVRVDTVWGADFSIDGSTWAEIPDTVTVAGPGTTITVREARAVLVNE
jgi:hypothetical protein